MRPTQGAMMAPAPAAGQLAPPPWRHGKRQGKRHLPLPPLPRLMWMHPPHISNPLSISSLHCLLCTVCLHTQDPNSALQINSGHAVRARVAGHVPVHQGQQGV